MKLSSFASLINLMMKDKMDLYRQTERVNADLTTTMVFSANPLYSNVMCHLSFGGLDNPGDSEVDNNPIKMTPKLFCPAGADIKAGDKVVVRRYKDDGSVMATYQGLLGLPLGYPTHMEVLFSIKGSA
jgi:hypothetical protein